MNRLPRHGLTDPASPRHRRLANRRRSTHLRPLLEGLEDRIVLSTITWDTTNFPTGGDWDATASWVGGKVPGASDDAVINLTSAGQVKLTSGNSDSVSSVTTNAKTTLRVLSGSLSLGVNSTTLGGPVEVGNGGTLSIGNNASVLIETQQTITVDAGGEMTVGAASVVLDNYYGGTYGINVAGTMTATGASFTSVYHPGNSPTTTGITVASGGHLTATNTTYAWDSLTLNASSVDTLSTVILYYNLAITYGATLSISENDFSNVSTSGIVASGDPNRHIDLTHNYWGSTDPVQIAKKIKDHNTDPTRPYIDFQPFVGATDQTIAQSTTATFSQTDQSVTLNASVTSSSGAVNEGTVTFTILNGTQVIGVPVTSGTVTNGAASATYTLPGNTVPGQYTIEAQYSGFGTDFLPSTDTSHTLTVAPAAPYKLVIHTPPSGTSTAGQTFGTQPVIYEEDQYGNLETGDNTTSVTVTLASGTGPLVGTTTVTVSGGVATFTNLGDNTAETITLKFSSGSLVTATSSSIVISPATASKVVFGQQPTNTTAGSAISPAVTVKVEDQFNNVVTTDTSTVTLTLSSGTFEGGSSTATAAASGGVATFSSLKIDTVGSYTVTATDGSLTGSGASNSFTISTAVAKKVVFGQQPTSTTAGTAISPAVTVKVEDQFNNVVTTDTSTVTLTLSSGTFEGGSSTATAAASGGVATFGSLKIDTVGSYTVTATDGSLTGSGASNSFTISTAMASKVVFGQQPTNATAGAAMTPAVTVKVEDAFGNVVTTDTSTVTLTLSSGTFEGGSTTATAAASGGVATFSSLKIDTLGSYTVTATDGTLTGSGASNSFTIGQPGGATKLAFGQQPTNATAGGAISPAVTVKVEDAIGNVVTTDTSTVTLTLSGGTFEGGSTTATATASGGIAAFIGLIIDAAGSYTLSATDGTLTASGASNNFTITPAAAAKLVFGQQPTETAAGDAIGPAVSVKVEDAFGNVVTTDTSTVTLALSSGTFEGGASQTSVAATSGVATFSNLKIDVPGSYTLSATDGGLTPPGPSSSFTIDPGPAVELKLVIPPFSSVVAGTPLTDPIVLNELDRFGNIVTTDNSTVVTASLASGAGTLLGPTSVVVKDGVASFDYLEVDKAGPLSLRFQAGTLPAVTSDPTTVSPAPASTLDIVKRPPGGVVAGQSFGLEADAFDPYGNVATSFDGPVTVGVASGAGSLSGSTTVTAAGGVATFDNLIATTSGTISLGVGSGTLTPATSDPIEVTPGPDTQLVVTTPPPSSITPGQPFDMGVSVEDQYHNVDPNFNGDVTIAIPGDSGFTPITVHAKNGVATFPGVIADALAQGASIEVTAPGTTLPPVKPPPIHFIPTVTVSVYSTPKSNKKGKAIGKPVFSGFKLVYSTTMSPTTGQPADYHVSSTVKKGKGKKTVTNYKNVPVKVSYSAATNTVILSLKSNQPFAKSGGQIMITGVTDQDGAPLDPAYSLFTIQPKAKSITRGGN